MKKNKISEATPSVTHRKAARKLIPCALLCSFTIAWMPLAITTPALAVSEEIVVASVNPSEKDGLRQGASNLLSGNLSLPLTLGSVTLTINTQSRFDQGFGPGASFAPSIKALSATEHLYTSSAGRSSLFRSGASMFTAAGDLRKLSTVDPSTIKIDGRASDYSLFTRAGNSQEFLIAEATDSFGAKTTFAYQAVGQKYLISKIVNSIGKETTFHVDNGRIARIDTPYEQFSLQYNSSGFLTAVLNQRGERLFYLERDNEYNLPISLSYRNNAGENELQFFSYTVDPTSKKAVLRAAGNALGTIQYAYHPDKTISRTSQGEVAEYNSVQTPLGARVSSVVAYVKDGAKTISTTSYDPQGRVAQQKDFAGWTTSYNDRILQHCANLQRRFSSSKCQHSVQGRNFKNCHPQMAGRTTPFDRYNR
jgi:hypothetical protein